jgi:hypothetical protein
LLVWGSNSIGGTNVVWGDNVVWGARMNLPPATSANRFAALDAAASGKNGVERFYARWIWPRWRLKQQPGQGYRLCTGAIADGAAISQDLNYGNAIYYGHFALDRVALQGRSKKEAVSQLSAPGATPGSTRLNTFGPNGWECEFRYQPEGWKKEYRFIALRKEKAHEEVEAEESEQYQLFETSQYQACGKLARRAA